MVSKKIHCAYCQKKCSGNVLRYQDHYYHKQCFEREQSESLTNEPESTISTTPTPSGKHLTTKSRPGLHVESATSLGDVSLRNDREEEDSTQAPSVQRDEQPFERNNQSKSIFASHSTIRSNVPAVSNIINNTSRHPTPNQNNSMSVATSRNPLAMATGPRSATLPHSISSPANGFSVANQQRVLTNNNNNNNNINSRTLDNRSTQTLTPTTTCAGCCEKIVDGQALIALDLHWHVWCFRCAQCRSPLHGEYVAKDGKAYCEKDYQRLFGITCVYCKRYITGKVLQAGEAHHFHPSCARCSKCGDPFVPGEEMYLQGEVTWHPRCGPGPNGAESSLMEADDRQSQLRSSRAQSPSFSAGSRSRSTSPFSYMARQYGRASPSAYADSEAVGDLSRIYTISYLNSDPNQGYLRRPIEPNPPKSPQFSRPTSLSRLGGVAASDRSRCSSRSQPYASSSGLGGAGRERSVPRGMYRVLSGLRSGSSSRARSPSMMNEEAIQLAAYPSGQKPEPDSVAKIERDDFPAPPFPYHPERQHHASSRAHSRGGNQEQSGASVTKEQAKEERASRPRSREITAGRGADGDLDSNSSAELDPQFRKEEEELSKIANGIGKIFLQTLKEREKLRAWKRANLDPRNASRTPSATRELPSRMRYENPANASPSRDLDRPRPWEEEEGVELQSGEQSPTRTRSSLGRSAGLAGSGTSVTPAGGGGGASSALSSSFGYKVIQSNRLTPRPGYGLTSGPYNSTGGSGGGASNASNGLYEQHLSFAEQQRIAQARAANLLGRQNDKDATEVNRLERGTRSTLPSEFDTGKLPDFIASGSTRSLASAAHFRRSMPNVASLNHLHQEGPPKLYPYHLLATSNYRLPPDVDRCHLERHLSNEEFQYIFHCDRIDFYRLPEWKRNELKRRARLF